MNSLVIGSGGREHALVLALKRSDASAKVYIHPGNDGILLDAEPLNPPSVGMQDLINAARSKKIELVVIGPEAELVSGYADVFREAGFLVFGPSQEAAKLEGSKIYSKIFMDEFKIPTARWVVVDSVPSTLAEAEKFSPPYVLKADGLAAGKGVFICKNISELEKAAYTLFVDKIFGAAGASAVLEEFQQGEELSLLALTNGREFQILPFCRDHKRLSEGDQGPNTGGMGVVAPVELPADLIARLQTEILVPTMRGFQTRNFTYRGVVFIGVMLTPNGPSVLEYNVRFGDPETQVILPLLDGQWLSTLAEVAHGRVPDLKWRKAASACVVLAAEGYPMSPVKGAVIEGLPVEVGQVQILHAGTKRNSAGKFVTNGGRVLNVVAEAATLLQALAKVYGTIDAIKWRGMQFRRDIGKSLI